MQDSEDVPTVASSVIKTIDGEEIERNEARNISRRNEYLTLFLFLLFLQC